MRLRIFIAALLSLAALPARAESPATQPDGYKGKTIILITSTGAGGLYDLVARMVARHMPRHIPGKPSIIVQNMPGGGNVLATNYMYNIAPRDGTALATIHSAMPVHQVLNGHGVRYDADKFNWLGSTGPQNEAVIVWHTAGIRTLEQAKAKEVILGGTGAGSGIVIIPTVMNSLLGTKFKIVTGYRTSEDINIGMQRGEVQARAFSLGSITGQHPDWITEKKVDFLAQVGARRDKLLPDVPLLTELATSEEHRGIFRLISLTPALGQPYIAPPGVPPGRLAILRKAFDATLRDEAFLADARKLRFDVDPMDAAEVTRIVRATIAAPSDLIAKARVAAGSPN
jgi:tripartite-type tricarboxylate transporter receptor subunit TctC